MEFHEEAILPENLSEKLFTAFNLFGLKRLNYDFETKQYDAPDGESYTFVVMSYFS